MCGQLMKHLKKLKIRRDRSRESEKEEEIEETIGRPRDREGYK